MREHKFELKFCSQGNPDCFGTYRSRFVAGWAEETGNLLNQPMARIDIENREQWREVARQSRYRLKPLSEQFQVCQRHLRRYSWELFGCSPQDWLDQERLTLAPDLLKELRSVKQVTFDLGFKHVSHFSRKFKEWYGLSPTAYLADAASGWEPSFGSMSGLPRLRLRSRLAPEIISKCPPGITNVRVG